MNTRFKWINWKSKTRRLGRKWGRWKTCRMQKVIILKSNLWPKLISRLMDISSQTDKVSVFSWQAATAYKHEWLFMLYASVAQTKQIIMSSHNDKRVITQFKKKRDIISALFLWCIKAWIQLNYQHMRNSSKFQLFISSILAIFQFKWDFYITN